MKELEEIKNNFDEYNKTIDQLVNIGSDVGDIVLVMLNQLKKEHEKLIGFELYKKRLNNVIEQISNIKDHKLLKDKYKIIYNHALVLIVSNFESFMTSLFIKLIDNYPEIIKWPEKKRIGIELSVLNYTTQSKGELIVRSLKGEINFQDLQSTLNFLNNYLEMNIDLGDDKDKIILYQAVRHAIVHNLGVVDFYFLKQVRNTTFKDRYASNDKISINQEEYNNVKRAFSNFVDIIMRELLSKIEQSPTHSITIDKTY